MKEVILEGRGMTSREAAQEQLREKLAAAALRPEPGCPVGLPDRVPGDSCGVPAPRRHAFGPAGIRVPAAANLF